MKPRELGNGIVEVSADFLIAMCAFGAKKEPKPAKPRRVSGPVIAKTTPRRRK